MAEEYSTIKIWEATSLTNNKYSDSENTRKFMNDTQIKLDYCIPVNWQKKRTDLTGVQSEVGVHPDTGPAGAFVEVQIVIDRSGLVGAPDNFLTNLIKWYGTINTNSIFKKGFLGLENGDNPELDAVPVANLGYKLVNFGIIDPVDFKGRQVYRILLQLGGKANDLPTRTPP